MESVSPSRTLAPRRMCNVECGRLRFMVSVSHDVKRKRNLLGNMLSMRVRGCGPIRRARNLRSSQVSMHLRG